MAITRTGRAKSVDPLTKACIATIEGIGRGVRARITRADPSGASTLTLAWHGDRHQYRLQVTRSHLSHAAAAGIAEQARRTKARWLLFAPYVPPKIGELLASHQVSYADNVGNCHLTVARGRLLAHIEGKKPQRNDYERAGGRAPSYQILFAILAEPSLLERPVREIAEASGAGKTAVANQLRRLEQRGLIDRKRSLILRKPELRDRWLSAYADVVRPAWFVGRYRVKSADPAELESTIEETWADHAWAYGGGAAAWRMTGYYRGPDTVVHVADLEGDAIRRLQAIPDARGQLTILRTPGKVAYRGVDTHLAHPLLVYTEMLISTDSRLREAAGELAAKMLEHVP